MQRADQKRPYVWSDIAANETRGYNGLWALRPKGATMAKLVLTNVHDGVLQQLQVRANEHGRTPEEEAKAILSEILQGPPQASWGPVDAIYTRLAASGRTFGDSADLLREDRDR